MLFYPFKTENEVLGGTSHTYHGKFVTEIVHNNQCKFEPYPELVDEASENSNAELVDNQDAYGQIENDQTITTSYDEDATQTDDSQNSSASYAQQV